ncbi:Low conductance mechanosensitive channel YnaI [Chlamydiales bacterium SCGC AG-110-M15]|nr:Low conductance mechanosensitive channel YnaI [Chlamydiales bacterium SCGC AG-110-M15]
MPAKLFIWIYALFAAVSAIAELTALKIDIDGICQIRQVVFVVILTWTLFRWKNGFEGLIYKRLDEKAENGVDKALYTAVWRLASMVIMLFAGLLILDALGVSLTAFVALGSVGTIAVTYSSTDVIRNFFGGMVMQVNRHFAVGDWIMSPNKNFEGTVESIGWYMTRIRTFERRPLFVPNSLLLDAIIENPGQMYNRRIKVTIGIRYEDVKSMDVITKDVEAMLRAHPDIAQDQTLMVHFLAFGPSSIDFNVYSFTKTTNWKEYRGIQQDVFLKIVEIIHSHGADIAFPTQTLHLQQDRG